MGSTLDTKTYLIQGDDNRKTVVLQGEGDMLLSDGRAIPRTSTAMPGWARWRSAPPRR